MSRAGGVTIATYPANISSANAMSYFPDECIGPYVVKAQWVPAFTTSQAARIAAARAHFPHLGSAVLTDACASRGGDSDLDGLCDDEDKCPSLPNLCDNKDTDGDGLGDPCDQCAGLAADTDGDGIEDPCDPCPGLGVDADGDGIDDGCDNCAGTFNPSQADYDGDCPGGWDWEPGTPCGDACDPDIAGDGCDNEDDDNPNVLDVVGTILTLDCGASLTSQKQKSAAGDSDGDGLKDCLDADDDDDGLCDPWVTTSRACSGEDNCPRGEAECFEVDAGQPCPPLWNICLMGDSCREFFIKIVSVINPADHLLLERFELVNDTIFAKPLGQQIASQLAKTIANKAQGMGVAQAEVAASPNDTPAAAAVASTRPGNARGGVRLEIWRRGTPAVGEERVRVVGEYALAEIDLGELRRGGVLRIAPERVVSPSGVVTETLHVDTTFGVGLERLTEPFDGDDDGWPDLVDDCVGALNPSQADHDGDGLGNACDADLDNDLRVDERDLARMDACISAVLDHAGDHACGSVAAGEGLARGLPAAAEVALADACRAADLDGDRRVSGDDRALLVARLGEVLDPALFARLPDPLSPLDPRCVSSAPLEKPTLTVSQLD